MISVQNVSFHSMLRKTTKQNKKKTNIFSKQFMWLLRKAKGPKPFPYLYFQAAGGTLVNCSNKKIKNCRRLWDGPVSWQFFGDN